MKPNFKILNKDTARWWSKTPTDWAFKKGDDWLIYRHKGSPQEDKLFNSKKMKINSKRAGERSNTANPMFLLIILSACLGISLALNIIFYLLK